MTRRGSIARVDYCIGMWQYYSATALFEVSLAGKPDSQGHTGYQHHHVTMTRASAQRSRFKARSSVAYIDSAAVGSNITTNATRLPS